MKSSIAAAMHLFLLISLACASPPITDKRPVTDTYHGTKVVDNYRWLEDSSSKEVQQWSDTQNNIARRYLNDLPGFNALSAEVNRIMTAKTDSWWDVTPAGGKVFVMRQRPPRPQPLLVVMDSVDDAENARVIIDPTRIDPTGKTRIDWFVPSPDGHLIAASLSRAGTESGNVHLFDTATGKQVHEVIPRVNGGTAGGALAWAPDGSGFYYTRYPRGKERAQKDMDFYQQAYFHKLGAPTEEDRYELGKDLPRIAEIDFDMDDRTGRLLATVQDGDGGEFAHFLRSPDGRWRQFSNFGDRIVQAIFGPGNSLYLVSFKDAPRGKILKLDGKTLDTTAAKTFIPQSKETIQTSFLHAATTLFHDGQLFVIYQHGGPTQIHVFDERGFPQPLPEQMPIATVYGLAPLGKKEILFFNGSFTDPGGWFRMETTTGVTKKTSLMNTSPVDFSDIKVIRSRVISKDGTRVPMTILLPPAIKRDGTNPCVVTGYGGYGRSMSPRYKAINHVLLEEGVILVVANLRGGGEFGEHWHRQGNLTNKQNVFDDFAAVCQYMIDNKYTDSSHLGIFGGSNGGLLMGAILTQHPDLARVVVSSVGIYDMLRVELSPNGAFNIPEFGTVKKLDHFKALHAYSPYHNVKDRVAYPATLFITGANDPRVDPMQSRKMTARLQSATTSDAPILLWTSADSGHGRSAALGTKVQVETTKLAFLLHHLGVKIEHEK